MDDSSRMMEKQSLFTIKQDDREGKRSSEVTLAQCKNYDNVRRLKWQYGTGVLTIQRKIAWKNDDDDRWQY